MGLNSRIKALERLARIGGNLTPTAAERLEASRVELANIRASVWRKLAGLGITVPPGATEAPAPTERQRQVIDWMHRTYPGGGECRAVLADRLGQISENRASMEVATDDDQ